MPKRSRTVEKRLRSLEQHLREENPLLVDAVKSFRILDKVGYRTGLLDPEQSYATQIAWWPLIAILGTFSAGKSTFINHYLRYPLQSTGTQAVDDKFTVVCFGNEDHERVLPGIALNSDLRFPFYKMSEELEEVAPGEGGRVDAYLQLKTVPSERVRGTILIDSPGFDADAQRNATLRITDYIIDLSDLVLVFFDARHPEPGAMQDTLTHLVGNTIRRRDSSKFMYILNQIDATAGEDNPEQVVGAWQRAIAQEGLTAGRFYTIYSPDAETHFRDEKLRERFERKRDTDLAEIQRRMGQVGVERAYRIIGSLGKTAHHIEETQIPRLRALLHEWRRGTLWRDGLLEGGLVVAVAALILGTGTWNGLSYQLPDWLVRLAGSGWGWVLALVVFIGVAVWLHFLARDWSARAVLRQFLRSEPSGGDRDSLERAFRKNTRAWRSVFISHPVGWGRRARKQLQRVIGDADRFIQALNDRFASPAGRGEATAQREAAAGNAAAPAAPAQPAEPEPAAVHEEEASQPPSVRHG